VDRVLARGLDAWLEEQLDPAAADKACEAVDAAHPVIGMDTAQAVAAYPFLDPYERMGASAGTGAVTRAEERDAMAAWKLHRAVACELQLREVLADFWFNHFNVSTDKQGRVLWALPAYERDAIRAHTLGRFRELLGAVAHSASMMVYLDNDENTIDALYAPPGEEKRVAEQEAHMKPGLEHRRRLGINENYARELMELHTLGVTGGYSEKDVVGLARIFTGWGTDEATAETGYTDFSGKFRFDAGLHDPWPKVFLGQTFKGDEGQAEGERALDLLARHPSTARHIALQLCRRFVADQPPPELVERVAAAFVRTDGDLRETYRALFSDPLFYAPSYFRAKTKSPFEFAVSLLRAASARPLDLEPLAKRMRAMGQPLYQCAPPTGWPEADAHWIDALTLLARVKLADELFHPVPGAAFARADAAAPAAASRERGPLGRLQAYADAYLNGELSPHTRAVILARLDHPALRGKRADPGALAAMVLASPEFQRR
jgi:uncharacterized protein (DUF1800 family)